MGMDSVATRPRLPHEARGRSGGRVDDVEAVQSHEDAIAATTSSSSSFLTLSQYLADDDFRIHEATLDLVAVEVAADRTGVPEIRPFDEERVAATTQPSVGEDLDHPRFINIKYVQGVRDEVVAVE